MNIENVSRVGRVYYNTFISDSSGKLGPLEVLDNLDPNVLVSYIDYDGYYEYKFKCPPCYDLCGHQDVWYFCPGIYQADAYWYPSPELPICERE